MNCGRQTGDELKVDLQNRTIDLLLSDQETENRRKSWKRPTLRSDSPWQELFRNHVGQLDSGGCLEFAVKYRNLGKVVRRHSH
jgi:xylonate dehydratase